MAERLRAARSAPGVTPSETRCEGMARRGLALDVRPNGVRVDSTLTPLSSQRATAACGSGSPSSASPQRSVPPPRVSEGAKPARSARRPPKQRARGGTEPLLAVARTKDPDSDPPKHQRGIDAAKAE
ncbi:hypothetical protein MASR1M101_36340 [Gemmatimonas sp.]